MGNQSGRCSQYDASILRSYLKRLIYSQRNPTREVQNAHLFSAKSHKWKSIVSRSCLRCSFILSGIPYVKFNISESRLRGSFILKRNPIREVQLYQFTTILLKRLIYSQRNPTREVQRIVILHEGGSFPMYQYRLGFRKRHSEHWNPRSPYILEGLHLS
jgi:hypothetical protein